MFCENGIQIEAERIMNVDSNCTADAVFLFFELPLKFGHDSFKERFELSYELNLWLTRTLLNGFFLLKNIGLIIL